MEKKFPLSFGKSNPLTLTLSPMLPHGVRVRVN